MDSHLYPSVHEPDFDNFEEATAKLGKRVILDMNDPYCCFIDDVESERATKRRKIQHKMVRMANGKLGCDLSQRFNFSNDAAYEALKENNQNRVRATLASIPVEHSTDSPEACMALLQGQAVGERSSQLPPTPASPSQGGLRSSRVCQPNVVEEDAQGEAGQ